jgi:hypothetical protein
MAAISVSTWRPNPGHRQDLLDAMGVAKKIHERLGGQVSVWGSAAGGSDPMAIAYTITHEDLAAYGKFAVTLAEDDEWESFMSAAMASDDPIAELVETTLGVSVDV